MAYTKTKWVNNSKPAINQDNLNHAEQGIADAHDLIAKETLARQKAIAEHGTAISTLQTSVSAILPASSGTAGQVLTKTATGADWQDVDGLPAGGTPGQVLTKTANGADWANIGCPFPVGFGGFFQTDPNTIYSGTTWQQKKDVFILAAGETYPAGSTGGEATHKLSWEEMPAHTHDLNKLGDHTVTAWGAASDHAKAFDLGNIAKDYGGSTNKLTTKTAGSGLPHNNMPPYYTMPFWIRTA